MTKLKLALIYEQMFKEKVKVGDQLYLRYRPHVCD